MKLLIGSLGRILGALLFFSPYFVRVSVAYGLAFLWWDLFRIRRKVVLDNLTMAYPDMTHGDKVRMGRRNLRHLGMNFVEYSYMPFLSRANVDRFVEIQNGDLLREVLARGKGALLLTCHLGNGDLGAAALAIHGFPMVMVSKFFKLKWLNDLWFGMREKLGMKFVAPRDSSFALLKGLKQGRAIVIPLDQFTGPPIGVRTTFFGHETGTAAGISVMAERSGAPVISVYAVRNPGGKHTIHFVRELPVRISAEETLEQITQRFNDELESFVRLHPEQWMWIHRRWKKFKF